MWHVTVSFHAKEQSEDIRDIMHDDVVSKFLRSIQYSQICPFNNFTQRLKSRLRVSLNVLLRCAFHSRLVRGKGEPKFYYSEFL